MNKETKKIIRSLMKDEEAVKAIRKLILANEPAPADNGVYVWTVRKTDVNTGKDYYHPVVVNTTTLGNPFHMPTVEEITARENTAMIADRDQFAAHRAGEHIARMIAGAYGAETRLIRVPREVFAQLKEALDTVMDKILTQIEKCFPAIEAAAELAHSDAEAAKLALLSSILGSMETLFQCVDEEFAVSTAEEHVYAEEAADNEGEGEEDEYDEINDAAWRRT